MADNFLEIKSDAEKMKTALAAIIEEAGSYKAARKSLQGTSDQLEKAITKMDDVVAESQAVNTELRKIKITEMQAFYRAEAKLLNDQIQEVEEKIVAMQTVIKKNGTIMIVMIAIVIVIQIVSFIL